MSEPTRDPVQALLSARFQQLAAAREEQATTPAELKGEVFRTLDLLDTLGEIGDLFTGKFAGAAADFIDLLEHTDPE